MEKAVFIKANNDYESEEKRSKDLSLLTMIIPCYNAEPYIERCISSLDKVNSKVVTILFVNDGSTDSTQKSIERWISFRENAFLINKENGGYCSAINKGLDSCKTEYVMFMGVDDEIDAQGINEICVYLKEYNPDILFFSTEKVLDENNSSAGIDSLTSYKCEGLYDMDLFSFCKKVGGDSCIAFVRDTSRCFKKSIIGSLRYYGKRGVTADGCFSSLVASRSTSFFLTNTVCYFWHLHDDSVSARKRNIHDLLDEICVWRDFFSKLLEDNTLRIPDHVINYLFHYKKDVQELYNNNEKKKANDHNCFIKKTIRELKLRRTITLKSRIKLLLPNLYFFAMYSRR